MNTGALNTTATIFFTVTFYPIVRAYVARFLWGEVVPRGLVGTQLAAGVVLWILWALLYHYTKQPKP